MGGEGEGEAAGEGPWCGEGAKGWQSGESAVQGGRRPRDLFLVLLVVFCSLRWASSLSGLTQ